MKYQLMHLNVCSHLFIGMDYCS